MPSVALPVISPRARRPAGCCTPPVEPDLAEDDARDLAAGFKALADPRRLTILDVLRKAAPEAICQCELTPLFPISQQALSKHMQVLTAAGMVGSERRGLWTFYYLNRSGIDELEQWLR